MLTLLALDDQFKYDWTEWNQLLLVIYIPGIILAYIIHKLKGDD